jgi:hypothetical protein
MIRRLFGSVLIAILAVASSGAGAQEKTGGPSAMPGPDVERRLKQKRDVVLPKPSEETVARDLDQAARALGGPGGTDQLIQEGRRDRAINRPDLDSSVVNGIQAENAARALGRR